MKKKTTHKPTANKFSLLRQLCNFIPPHLVPRLARETGVEDQARTFSPWSHVVSLLYAQITHSLGLNDVCDALRLHSGPLSALRGATLPPKNTLSYANRTRDPKMAYVLLRFCDWLGPVEPQLHPPLRPHPLGPLAKNRFAQPLGKLWDSRGWRSLPRPARSGLSGGLRLILWDSHAVHTGHAPINS